MGADLEWRSGGSCDLRANVEEAHVAGGGERSVPVWVEREKGNRVRGRPVGGGARVELGLRVGICKIEGSFCKNRSTHVKEYAWRDRIRPRPQSPPAISPPC